MLYFASQKRASIEGASRRRCYRPKSFYFHLDVVVTLASQSRRAIPSQGLRSIGKARRSASGSVCVPARGAGARPAIEGNHDAVLRDARGRSFYR